MPSNKNQIFDRVCEALGVQKASQVAAILKITGGSISQWKRTGNIALSTLVRISELSGASIHWLLTGKGEKYVSAEGTSLSEKSEKSRRAIKLLAPSGESQDTVEGPRSQVLPKILTTNFAIVSIPLIGTISATLQRIIVHEEQELVQVPQILTSGDALLLQIEGHDLESEGLHDGDLLIVETANGDSDQKIVVAIVPGERTIIRHYHRAGRIAHFAPIEGNAPVIRFPARDVEIRYVVTSITRRTDGVKT